MEEEKLPIVTCVRTALAQEEEGIFRRLPEDMRTATIKEIVNYSLQGDELSADEQPMAVSIREEMAKKDEYTININGKENLAGDEKIRNYLTQKEDTTEDGTKLNYDFADVRIASAQEGGPSELEQKII